MPSLSIKVTGRLVNLAGLVSPALAGRLAFDLFCSTRPAEPSTAKERQLFASGRQSMSQARLVRLIIVGGEVACWHFPPIGQPSGQTFLVVHGWGSRTDYLHGLITSLRQTGAEVIGLDLPGHGKSGGRKLNIALAVDAIDAANRQFGPFDTMIGHSFGGFAAVMAAAGAMPDVPATPPGRLVLVAAPASAESVFAGFSKALGFTSRVRKALAKQAQRVVGLPVSWFSGPGMLADLNVETLVIHAEDDKEVPADAARAYEKAGPHVGIVWAYGLGHRRIINSPDVIGTILSFVENRPQMLARIA